MHSSAGPHMGMDSHRPVEQDSSRQANVPEGPVPPSMQPMSSPHSRVELSSSLAPPGASAMQLESREAPIELARGWAAMRTGELARDAGEPARARAGLELSLSQWRAVDDLERCPEVEAALCALGSE